MFWVLFIISCAAAQYVQDATGHSASSEFACLVIDNTQLACAGYQNVSLSYFGIDTLPSDIYVLPVTTLSNVSQFFATATAFFIINTDNELYCWGENVNGVLGLGLSESATVDTPTFLMENVTLFGVVSVDDSNVRACALTGAKDMYCWGSNVDGLAGVNTTDNATFNTPQWVMGGVDLFSMGLTTVGLVTQDNDFYCWGDRIVCGDPTNTTGLFIEPEFIASDVYNIFMTSYYSFYTNETGHMFVAGDDAPEYFGGGIINPHQYVFSDIVYVYVTLSGDIYTIDIIGNLTVGGTPEDYVYPHVLHTDVTAFFPSEAADVYCFVADELNCWGANDNNKLAVDSNDTVISPPMPVLSGCLLDLDECSATQECHYPTSLCVCIAGWSGTTCTTPNCMVDLNGCNDHGTCEEYEVCACDAGWAPPDCAERIALTAVDALTVILVILGIGAGIMLMMSVTWCLKSGGTKSQR